MAVSTSITDDETITHFIAPDADDQPTLWQRVGKQAPEALARRCDVHPAVWTILRDWEQDQ